MFRCRSKSIQVTVKVIPIGHCIIRRKIKRTQSSELYRSFRIDSLYSLRNNFNFLCFSCSTETKIFIWSGDGCVCVCATLCMCEHFVQFSLIEMLFSWEHNSLCSAKQRGDGKVVNLRNHRGISIFFYHLLKLFVHQLPEIGTICTNLWIDVIHRNIVKQSEMLKAILLSMNVGKWHVHTLFAVYVLLGLYLLLVLIHTWFVLFTLIELNFWSNGHGRRKPNPNFIKLCANYYNKNIR